MHKLPEAVQPPESPCVLLQHTQRKPAEICSPQNAEVAPSVFCRTVRGAGVAWLLLTAVCTDAWSICPGSVPENKHRVSVDSRRAGQTCHPFSAPKVLCTALAARARLLVLWVLEQDWKQRELTSTFPYALHEAPSFPRANATNLGIAGPNFQESNIF